MRLSLWFMCCFALLSACWAMDARSETEYDSELEDFEVIERQLEGTDNSQKTMDEAKLAAEETKLDDDLTTLARDRGYDIDDDDEDGVNRSYDDADAINEYNGLLPAGFADRDDVAVGPSRQRRDLTFFQALLALLRPREMRNRRVRCPNLPAMAKKPRCERTDTSEIGELKSCRVTCQAAGLEKSFAQYEVCGKQTKYFWSYELKGFKNPLDSCIEEAKRMGENAKSDGICTTKECLETGAYYTSKIDYKVNPCSNFYDYACGRWQREVEVPRHRMSVSTYSIIRDRVSYELASALNSPAQPKDIDAVRKTKKIYRSCVDTGVIELRQARPLLDILRKELAWPIIERSKTKATVWRLTDAVARLRRYNNDNIFKFHVTSSGGKYHLGIYRGKMAMSLQAYTRSDFNSVRNAYYLLIYETAVLLGAPISQARNDMLAIRRFELAYAKLLQKHSNDYEDASELISLNELDRKYSNDKISFFRLVDKMILEHKMTRTTMIKVKNPKWLRDVMQLIKDTDERTLQNYVVWRFVKHRLENLSSKYRNLLLSFRRSYGVSEHAPRWQTCSSQIMYGLPTPTGNLFISDYFSKAKKDAAQELFQNVRKGFLYNLQHEVTWMDDVTKAKARAKAKAIRGFFGYNAQLYDNTTLLNEEMKQFHANPLDYFGNTLQILEYVASEHFQLLNVEHKRAKMVFTTRPSMVNAFYSPSDNSVLLPAGEMQYPFYWGDKFPRMFQFGAIGTILGHEITHGFDNNGRRFDLHGNVNNWWTAKSLVEFNKRTQCIVDQFSNYYYASAGENVNGKQTLGENIADLGGIRNSHAGYQFWLKSKNLTREQLEPVTGLTNDQMFFVGFANVRCAKEKRFAAEAHLAMDVHSPGRFRVIGSLQDFEKFSEAFQCPLGSFMNPRKKCILW